VIIIYTYPEPTPILISPQIEQLAEGQAHWLEQVSLKDRASFLDEQKALHDAWKADMQALVEGQNTALQQVVMQTAAVLRAQTLASGSSQAAPVIPQQASEARRPASVPSWRWISAVFLLGSGAALALALSALAWTKFAGQ
jgi:hypothetical protein